MSEVSLRKQGWHPSGPIDFDIFKFFNSFKILSLVATTWVIGVVVYPGILSQKLVTDEYFPL